ncbi:hypothetical protein Pcac1_g2149 [Phytophthora cactorum]|nr:hypothetical protein Pcac1_g2149 [Phytophthora cactorum]
MKVHSSNGVLLTRLLCGALFLGDHLSAVLVLVVLLCSALFRCGLIRGIFLSAVLMNGIVVNSALAGDITDRITARHLVISGILRRFVYVFAVQ